MICLALTGTSLKENLAFLKKYRNMVDLCELRADFLDPWNSDEIRQFPLKAGIPVIFTLRRKSDGGYWTENEKHREQRIISVLSSHYAYVDLEKDSHTAEAAEHARKIGVEVIRSQHDFNGVPENFSRKIEMLPEHAGEIPKYAVMPKSTEDLRRVLNAMRITSGKRIILGMGDWGFPSRILSSYYGCWFTFVSPSGSSAAPGHVDPEVIRNVYRHHLITQSTEIFGIIGNPIMHSRSPLIHNRGYSIQKMDAVYIPFKVDNLDQWFSLAEEIPVKAFSVTIPHKENVISRLSETSPAVERVGACNTVVRNGKPHRWYGENTDISGFLHPLKDGLFGEELGSKKAAVIGAGGAARAVVYGLQNMGFDILILNRTAAKAEKLAHEFGCRHASLGSESWDLLKLFSDLIVQTTALGMHPLEDRNPLEGYHWSGSEVAYDLIYAPEKTRFLKSAEQAGCTTINGMPMLLEQGKGQYRLYTGSEYPADASLNQ